jgi:hypothetical protein
LQKTNTNVATAKSAINAATATAMKKTATGLEITTIPRMRKTDVNAAVKGSGNEIENVTETDRG